MMVTSTLVGREKIFFEAVQLLDQAITRDPAFILAHCQLASINSNIYSFNYDHTETRLALAEARLRAARRLQPDAGATHLAQAAYLYYGSRNYEEARKELANAQWTFPNNAEIFQLLGCIDRRQERWDDAIQNFARAVDLDPRNASHMIDLGYTYFKLRRYEEAMVIARRALALEPRNGILRAAEAWIGFNAHADMSSFRAVLNTIEADSASSAAEVSELSFQLALCEHDVAAATRALRNIASEGYIDFNGFPFPHAWYEGLVAKLRQDAPAARTAFVEARTETEKLVLSQQENEKPLSVLALIDAELGEKNKAIQEGRAACDMIPRVKDATFNTLLNTNLARIYAVTKEKDLALGKLEIVSKFPFGPSYGELRLDPVWDWLRGEPRFEKLLEESKKEVRVLKP